MNVRTPQASAVGVCQDLVTAHQSGSEEELEKAVVNITIDTLCRLL